MLNLRKTGYELTDKEREVTYQELKNMLEDRNVFRKASVRHRRKLRLLRRMHLKDGDPRYPIVMTYWDHVLSAVQEWRRWNGVTEEQISEEDESEWSSSEPEEDYPFVFNPEEPDEKVETTWFYEPIRNAEVSPRRSHAKLAQEMCKGGEPQSGMKTPKVYYKARRGGRKRNISKIDQGLHG